MSTSASYYRHFLEIKQLIFVGPLIPLFWTSGDVSSGFQSQSEQPYLHLVEAYMLHIPRDSPLVQHLSRWQMFFLGGHMSFCGAPMISLLGRPLDDHRHVSAEDYKCLWKIRKVSRRIAVQRPNHSATSNRLLLLVGYTAGQFFLTCSISLQNG